MKKILITLFLLSFSLYAKNIVIAVTIEPQKFIIEKIAKTKVKIITFYKGSDFNIKFKKLVLNKFAESDIYMIMNLDIETPFLKELKDINKNIEIFDMSKDIKKSKTNGIINSYVWLDPLKTREIAKTVFFKLSDMDPKNRSFYRENYESFALELDELYVKIKQLLSKSSFSVYSFDGYWDYYLSRFDLPMYQVPRRVLSAAEITSFIKVSKKRDAKVLIVDKKIPLKIVRSVASNSTTKIIKSSIFNYTFMGDLLLLSQAISKE